MHFKDGIELKAIAVDDEKYLLTIKKGDRSLFKEQVNGVSKVLLSSNKLLFSTFTYVDEDGHNEGYGYIVDVLTGHISKLQQKLSNTCNPIIYGNGYCFLNGGQIIYTTSDLKPLNSIPISYRSKKIDNSYLDEHSINGFATSLSNKKYFQIIFTPNKSSDHAGIYQGSITENTSLIILKNTK